MSQEPRPLSSRPASSTNPRMRRGRFDRWWNQVQVGWRRTRRELTRENILSNLYTLIFVVPLTVLIWIIAEQQQTQKEANILIQVQIKSDDPVHQLASLRDETPQVTIEIEGSNFGVQKVKDEAAVTRQKPIEILVHGTRDLLDRRGSEIQKVDILRQLAQDRMFTGLGVTVKSCSPQTLNVRVDTIDEIEVDVAADAPGLGETSFNPPKVKMRGPGLSQIANLRAMADLSSDSSLKIPGEHKDVKLKLMPPSSLTQEVSSNTTITPDNVMASLTVREPDIEQQVSGVLLREDAAPSLIVGYSVKFPQTLPTPITVQGPPSDIARFVDGPVRPTIIGYITIDSDQAVAGELRPIKFFRILDAAGNPMKNVRVKEPYPSVSVDVSPR